MFFGFHLKKRGIATMSKFDEAWKDYFSDNSRFADIMNMFCFQGERVIDPEDVKVAIDRYYTSNNSSSDSKEGKRKVGNRTAQYMTELPSKELLQRQLHKGLEAARQRWENCQED